MLVTNLGSNNKKVISKSKIQLKRYFLVLLSITLVAIISLLLINILKKDDTNKESSDSSSLASNVTEAENKKKVDDVLTELRKILLITDENITVVTITDVEKLKANEPDFYKDALNGDYIIIMDSEKLAVLFRLEERRIIKISPVKIDI